MKSAPAWELSYGLGRHRYPTREHRLNRQSTTVTTGLQAVVVPVPWGWKIYDIHSWASETTLQHLTATKAKAGSGCRRGVELLVVNAGGSRGWSCLEELRNAGRQSDCMIARFVNDLHDVEKADFSLPFATTSSGDRALDARGSSTPAPVLGLSVRWDGSRFVRS